MSKSRAFASLANNVDPSGAILPSGISADVSLGPEVYDSLGELPFRGLSNGDQAFVGNRLYISNGSGWYNVGLVNLAPSITSGPGGVSYELDGTSTVSISLIAVDSDGTAISWSFSTSDSAYDLATITNDSDGTFNVTGKALDDILVAGYDSSGGSFDITFTASDGISFDADSASFTLTYVVSIDWSNVAEQQKFQASDASANIAFGESTAIDGDTIIAGARGLYSASVSGGAAYVFTRSGSTWTQQQKLTASDPEADDYFGFSVSVYGDTAIVGAYSEDTGASGAGAAYIFTRSGSTWTQQQKIQASDASASSRFGWAVAIYGDTVIVGARLDSEEASFAGAAYIFTRSGSTWTQQQKLTASDAAADDYFGEYVAISGDTVIVGAPKEDTGASSAGAAYIFTRSGSAWTQQQKIQASDAEASDNFGESVTIDGDTVAVGALYEDTGESNAGAVYIFTRSGSTWTQQQKIQASDAEASDNFGQSVALSGDNIVVGAHREDTGASGAGAAYIFTRSESTWTQQAKIQASDAEAGDNFGKSVAISSDTIAIGADGEDTGASGAGAVYVFTA